MAKKLKPMHPGEVLREEFLVPLKMSAGTLAKACALPRTRIERIASEQTGITADTALRLAKALGTTAQRFGSIYRTTTTFRSRSTISASFSIASRP
jgi:antitoxin HigA-1